MPTVRRALALIIAVAALLPALGSVAAAAGPVSHTVRLLQAAYFWREQQSNVAGTGAAPPTGPLPDQTVPKGDLAVAGPDAPATPAEPGGPEKETYLQYDLSAVPIGSHILSFVISLPVDKAGQNSIPAKTAPPIVACLPKSAWAGVPGPQAFSGKPADSCAATPPKLVGKNNDQTFTANIAPIAQSWVSEGLNTGVAITDLPSNKSTAYQVVFGPASKLSKLTALVSYQPSVAGPVLHTQLTGTGSVPAGPPAGGVPPAAAPGGPAPSSAGGVPPAQHATAPRAMGHLRTPSFGGAPGTRPAAASSPTGSSVPAAGFWIAVALFVGLLGIASTALGRAPVAATAGRGVTRRLARGSAAMLRIWAGDAARQ